MQPFVVWGENKGPLCESQKIYIQMVYRYIEYIILEKCGRCQSAKKSFSQFDNYLPFVKMQV